MRLPLTAARMLALWSDGRCLKKAQRRQHPRARYVATMVVEMRWLGPLTLPGRLL
jgi:hypothetical protein